MTAPRRSAIVLEKPEEYDIKKSKEKIGPLYPVLKSSDGRIIDGIHRLDVDKNWPVKVVDIKGDLVLVARIVSNMQRRDVSPEEKTKMLGELAYETGWTSEKIAEETGMSISWVRKYLPTKYKNKAMANLASKKYEKRMKPESPNLSSNVAVCPKCNFPHRILVYVCSGCGDMREASQGRRAILPRMRQTHVPYRRKLAEVPQPGL